MANIISVSRRTDIPHYFLEYFLNCLKKGYAKIIHPFSRKEIKISLKKEDILGFVFWSKNFKPILTHLNEIESYSKNFYFHFTINQHPKEIEPLKIELEELVKTFKILSKRYGKENIVLRFDPILPNSIYPLKNQLENFKNISNLLEGYTNLCITSFMYPYKKTIRKIKKRGFNFIEDPISLKKEILETFNFEAKKRGLKLKICSSDIKTSIEEAKCINGEIFKENIKKSPSRKNCNCDFSLDIGFYNTCKTKCLYCYSS